jgi:hypothetical protein
MLPNASCSLLIGPPWSLNLPTFAVSTSPPPMRNGLPLIGSWTYWFRLYPMDLASPGVLLSTISPRY